MAKTKISEFDSTPANNTDIDSINIAEGCAPSGINNAIRELMSQLKDQQTGASADNFTVGGNLAVTGTSAFTGNVAFAGATTFTGAVTFSSSVVMSTALPVASGGTGAATLTANNVLLGNGTSTPQFVAPSTSGNILTSNGTTWASSAPAAYPLTSGTAVASTSGTSIDFTSIPSWVKRITVMFSGVSTSGTSAIVVQLGTSGGVQTTGYSSGAWFANTSNVTSSVGLLVTGSNANTYDFNGVITITLLNSSTGLWTHSSILCGNVTAATNTIGGGSKTLSGTLDRVRITTVAGTDTFDAGSINILYE